MEQQPKKKRRGGLLTDDVRHWVTNKREEHPDLALVYCISSITITKEDNPLNTTTHGMKQYQDPYRELMNSLSGIDFPVLRPEKDKDGKNTGLHIMGFEGLYHSLTMNRKIIDGAKMKISDREFVTNQFMAGNNGGSGKIRDVQYQQTIADLCTTASYSTKQCCKEVLCSLAVLAFGNILEIVKKQKTDELINVNDHCNNLESIRRHATVNFTFASILYQVNTLIKKLVQSSIFSAIIVDWVCKVSNISLSRNTENYYYKTTGTTNKQSGIKLLLRDASNEFQTTNTGRVMTCINKESATTKHENAHNLFSFINHNAYNNNELVGPFP